ncbi:MAG: DNA methylase [Eubacterium sp.]|nr:DNA methylase [Eubacterium sp.]
MAESTHKIPKKTAENIQKKVPGTVSEDVSGNRTAGSERTYIAIDLKSFYASVECRERGLDPLTTNLVVADASRTEKTICLAVSPSLKAVGLPGRARLFEVVQKAGEVNAARKNRIGGKSFSGKSYSAPELAADPTLELTYIAAVPRMALYMQYSARIYDIYLRHVAPEDIHVYSVDEVFIDVTAYLRTSGKTAHDFADQMIREVLAETGITATAGIAPNLFLCKAAMDIVAKHIPPDENGVRIAELSVSDFRRKLWTHRPLTDFWRVGPGIAKKLHAHAIYTMGDIARCSLQNEELLYKLFGVNAELLIDHAWGIEPCTMAEIKAYKPQSSSTGSGQVLQYPHTVEKARLLLREMAVLLAYDLLNKRVVTDQIVINVGYDRTSLDDPKIRAAYKGEITVDRYGRSVPKMAHGSIKLAEPTSSSSEILEAATKLYDRIVNRDLLVRRLYITAGRVVPEDSVKAENSYEQLDLFTDYEAEEKKRAERKAALEKERRAQGAVLELQKKFGKNAVLKGMNLEEGAMTVSRNKQIGGHKA